MYQINFAIIELMKKIPKALVLLSGGLDSMLAARALQNQGIKVTGLSFKSYFFSEKAAKKAAKNLKILLSVVDFSKEHLKMVKNPKHGYGKSMNPCIDCHALMLKKAKGIMKKEKFDFVATGEVLGERPMSQNPKALKTVEKESSLVGYLLRPLSAKLLEPTIPEQKRIVDRSKLFNISGRSRKKQIELARFWGIKDYPTPAGGCLLTDPEFGKKLNKLFGEYPRCNGNDIELLRVGRHFWEDKVKIIVGRNDKENKIIKKLAKKSDILVEMKDYSGPTTLIRNYSKKKVSRAVIDKTCELTKYYSIKTRGKNNVKFIVDK